MLALILCQKATTFKQTSQKVGMGHDFRIFDLIIDYRLGCAIISKGVPGLDNKDCPMA